MKRTFIQRIMCIGLLSVSLLGVSSVGANAEWRKQDSTGQWIYMENGSYSTGWKEIDNKWYYFAPNGYMTRNTYVNGYQIGDDGAWIQNNTPINNATINTSNSKLYGWQVINGKKYFYDATGTKVVNNWLNDKGIWYYLTTDGSLATNTIINGHTVGNDGVLIGNDLTSSNTNNNSVVNTNTTTVKTNNDNSNNEDNDLLAKLNEEKENWEKDNSTFAKGNIEKLQDRIDTINKDSAYKKMNADEQQATLISDKQSEISKLESELEQWKKDDSIESKKHQYDIQQEIKDAEDYIDIISNI